ncbi:serine protease gd-like [Lutzomyia longipalpis]|uniref:serine protease gd-like n=1 Tax=Lutzomyia longipalpis TaxID=7200 RepID=UPI0024837E6C|nr:serine protease gd-like [Lutzomyia longipalpis]
MILMKFLVIFSAFQIAIAQRYNVCGDAGLKFVYMSAELGWVGIGWAWIRDLGDVRKFKLDLEYESSTEPDPNNLGKLQILNIIPVNHPQNDRLLNMVYEFKPAAQKHKTNVTKIVWDGETICDLNVTKPYVVKIHTDYNFYTKERTFRTEVINRLTPKPTVEPVQLNSSTEDYDDSEVVGCGRVDTRNIYVPLVLEGQTIERGQWPWLVSVYSYSKSKLGFRCGATLISNKLVVTAAHCFFDVYNRKINSDDVLIILGQYNLKRPQDQGSEIVYPESVNIHPTYRKLTKIDSDIAVVVLAERVRFTHYIRPACLWKGPDTKDSIVGKRGYIAGWGRDEHGNFFSELPKQSEIPVVSDETCLRSHEVFVRITSSVTFCAGWRNGTEGPCNGDSGGPFVFKKDGRWTLRGVVSTSLLTDGSNTCNLNEYVVFTDVAQFTDWITSFDTDYIY